MTEARPERVVTAAALRLSPLAASPDALSDQDAGVAARGVVVHPVEKPGRTAARGQALTRSWETCAWKLPHP